ncbi:MAG TPA: MBL fold metallo-hydrolase [Candidatus Saccharimonadales bacterium]|jgi:L-ascorbate metabolism protein UlaG (beta-lactamase superfamily)|nr:MBL fold metallo-hydrolase [Candidatus Saccharimonadales bacterium]
MKITKHEHACVVLEDQGKKVIIDPGDFTPTFGSLDNVVAVVVTHVHGDHFSAGHLQQIIQTNPDVIIFTTDEIVNSWQDPHAKAVHAYEDHQAGPFSFRFFGEKHATIHSSVAVPDNVGVLVNNSFYYPGDSLIEADRDVTVLAIPACAPWLKIGEAMDLITVTAPKRVFPTHDAMLSDIGHKTADSWLSQAAAVVQAEYMPLKPGESFDY